VRARVSQLRVGDHACLDGREFTVTNRWPEDRGPGYTEVQFDAGEKRTFCWDYENPEVTKP
jgi:hypothetical protein